jgi:hypothetical protein
MSLLPEDNDEPISLLPPEEQNTPDIDMFVGDGGSGDYEERKRLAIPKYKNLLPKKVIARPTGAAALVVTLLFGLVVYFNIQDYIKNEIVPTFDWAKFLDYIIGAVQWILNPAQTSSRELIGVIVLGFLALMVIWMWSYSDRKVSSCPVCKKRNVKNENTCSKCEYIFYDREIITREVMSIKLNNLDFKPEDIANELKERRLADMNPKYVKKILVKNHFL